MTPKVFCMQRQPAVCASNCFVPCGRLSISHLDLLHPVSIWKLIDSAPLPICSHQQIIYLVVIKKQIMGEKINLKFVRPEHSSRINCVLGTNRGKSDENTLLWTCRCDCFEEFLGCFFLPRLLCPNGFSHLRRVISPQ